MFGTFSAGLAPRAEAQPSPVRLPAIDGGSQVLLPAGGPVAARAFWLFTIVGTRSPATALERLRPLREICDLAVSCRGLTLLVSSRLGVIRMRRPLAGIRLPNVNTALVVAGAALVLVAVLGQWVTIGGNQIVKGAPWWVPVVVGTFGVAAIVWGLWVSREHRPALRTAGGFLGAPPKMPDRRRLVSRPDLSQKIAQALRAGDRLVALTGMAGTGKSTLAAEACPGPAGTTVVPGRGDLAGNRPGTGSGRAAGRSGRRLGLRMPANPPSPRRSRAVTSSLRSLAGQANADRDRQRVRARPAGCPDRAGPRLHGAVHHPPGRAGATFKRHPDPGGRADPGPGPGAAGPLGGPGTRRSCRTTPGRCAPGWGSWRWAWRWPGRWPPGAGPSPTCWP